VAPPPPVQQIARPQWLGHVLITQYYSAPERWFRGRLVGAPGLPGRHRVDWLYSASGVAMEGDGIGADGRRYHFAGPYAQPWHNASGGRTVPCRRAPGYWTAGSPRWIGPTWLNRFGQVTFPLEDGWSNGPSVRTESNGAQLRFGTGSSLTLASWRSAAVDRRLIPRGSSLFVPAYCNTPGRGWLVASDTGGAIIGRHIDVYRSPPAIPWTSQTLRDQRIYVVPPGYRRPSTLRCR